ncbi:tetratricopeptide repeat protein [Acidobacteria bacterium AH-259-D05]|nr:tetratricopeptide repeat protein [Acidobacteria bacterium AH-259-D05]
MLNCFSTNDVSSILGVKAGRLRYWKRIGLVKPSTHKKGRHYYDFHDLICLKTAQGLIDQGLQATKMKRSVESLRKIFPEFEDHWAGKRIYLFRSRAIISHKAHLVDTQSGQLVFKFNLDDFAEEVESRVKHFHPNKTAEDWFREGLKYDASEESYPRALHAYQEALRLNPNFADAYVNMGNVYYYQKHFEDAQRCYRLGIESDPDNAKAYFNLGNTLDEVGCTKEAIHAYQKSLDLDPNFPDVYYNLAATCEKLELWRQASQHWKSYLELDSGSEYAEFARKRIKLLRSNLAPP